MTYVNDVSASAPQRAELEEVRMRAPESLTAQRLLDPQMWNEPADFYRQLLDEAPVWRVPGVDLVVVSSFDAVTEAVRRPQDFSSNLRSVIYRDDDGAPALTDIGIGDGTDVLATADPPAHAEHRAMVFPNLVARRMKELRPSVDRMAAEFMDPPVAAGSFEFMSAVANAIPIRVVARLIGFVDDDPDDLLAAAFDSTGMLAAGSLDDTLAAMARAAEILDWMNDQVTDAVANGRDGLLGLAADAVRSGELDVSLALVMMHTLLSAGGESTTSLLGNAVEILATLPDVQEAVRAEPELLTPFIEEVLRLESPFRYHLRLARNETELDGIPVPAGSSVMLLWAAANRDPSRFETPDELRLDREFPRDHVGFGRGIHLCVGAPLARIEADAVLGRLLTTTSWVTLGDRQPLREESLMVRRLEQLDISVQPA